MHERSVQVWFAIVREMKRPCVIYVNKIRANADYVDGDYKSGAFLTCWHCYIIMSVRIQLGQDATCETQLQHSTAGNEVVCYASYPSAGSPTETLLRFLLSLSDKVKIT